MATFLIFFSYITNVSDVGAVVLLLHDFSDIFLIVLRVYADYKVYYIYIYIIIIIIYILLFKYYYLYII